MSNFVVYIFHALGMLAFVGVGMPLGAWIARFYPNFSKWLELHEFIMYALLSE